MLKQQQQNSSSSLRYLIRYQFLNSLHRFGTEGHAFMYYLPTEIRNLAPRSVLSHIVGWASDERLARLYVPASRTIQKVRFSV